MPDDLLKRLRKHAGNGFLIGGEAADRIAALTAEVESLRAQMLKAITYIQMNGADQELTIVINCAYRAGLTQAAIDHALAQGTEQGLT